MSPLVTRPSLPEPSTLAGSTPVSAAILRTDGASGVSADAAAAGFGRLGRLRGRSGSRLSRRRGAPAPSLIWPSKAPTATVSPSFAAMSPSTPAAGAGTSMVTLSVSSSTSGSSTATASPGFLNHLPMVASVTDSPRVGTRISAMIVVHRAIASFRCHRPRRRTIQYSPTTVCGSLGPRFRGDDSPGYPNASSSNCFNCA